MGYNGRNRKLNSGYSGFSKSSMRRGNSILFGRKGVINTAIKVGTIILNSDTESTQMNNKYVNTYSIYDKVYFNKSDLTNLAQNSLSDVAEMINNVCKRRKQITDEVKSAKRAVLKKKILKFFLCIVYPFVKNTIFKINTSIKLQHKEIVDLNICLKKCCISLNTEMSDDIKKCYEELLSTFYNMSNSQKIWHIPSFQYINQYTERTSAYTSINRINIKFRQQAIPEIKCDFESPCFRNTDKTKFCIYPSFVVILSKNNNTTVIDIQDLKIRNNYTSFIEEGLVPSDSKILYHTWYKANKDGSRDKRFKDNYEIPVVEYGTLEIDSDNGVNEHYLISNYNSVQKFTEAFKSYIEIITRDNL